MVGAGAVLPAEAGPGLAEGVHPGSLSPDGTEGGSSLGLDQGREAGLDPVLLLRGTETHHARQQLSSTYIHLGGMVNMWVCIIGCKLVMRRWCKMTWKCAQEKLKTRS